LIVLLHSKTIPFTTQAPRASINTPMQSDVYVRGTPNTLVKTRTYQTHQHSGCD